MSTLWTSLAFRPLRGLRLCFVPVAALLLLACATRPEAPLLRIGTSGDYAPFSVAAGEALSGFDVDVARAFARDTGVRIEWVRFRWPELLADLSAGRFDLAMSGITMRPERSLVGQFTVPVVESGAVALVRRGGPLRAGHDLDSAAVRIVVNAGGHLERTARRLFPGAQLLPIPDNAAVLDRLLAGDADAAITDTLEAPSWLERAVDFVVLGPLTRDRKSYLVRTDLPELAVSLDRWLLAREADGTLSRLRREHLPGDFEGTATPLSGLVAALDERLSLMPLVAEAKRRSGSAVRNRERERVVLEAAVASVLEAARAEGLPVPADSDVRRFFTAQIEAAVAVQRTVLAGPPAEEAEPPPDLVTELRPALLRIGERIARLLVALPPGLPQENAATALVDGLRTPGLPPDAAVALAEPLSAIAR